MDIACPVCGRPVHREPGKPGRPRIYDTKRCRKAAEHQERQRLYRLGRVVDAAIREPA
jgi:hypothetical protein